MSSWILPAHQRIDDRDERNEAWRVELRDLARGFAGALFVSVPLLYTEEMWLAARTLSAGKLLLFLLVSFGAVFGMTLFAGFRKCNWQKSALMDAVVAMGIGAVAATLTLFVAGIIRPDMPLSLIGRLIAIETVATAIGAAVASNQLGSGDAQLRDRRVRKSQDELVVFGTLLGGLLFAFNIAPTMETKIVATGQDWALVAATFLLSIAVAFITVNVAEFEERDLSERRVITSPWLEALIAYLISFTVSAWLLWQFSHIVLGDPIATWLPQVVTLAYSTSLGGAAGRIVL